MVRRLRLASGLVLFAYLLTHFLNHALGLVSIEALEAGRLWFLLLWRNLPASLLLYGALVVHLGLAFWSLYQRRRLVMPAWEAAQLLTGLAIPPLLAIHILGSRFVHEVFGTDDFYTYTLLVFFEFNQAAGLRQMALMAVAWVHAMVGLHFWLRIRPWYPKALPYAFAAALLVPVTALLGVLVAGRDVVRLAADPAWLEAALARIGPPGQAGVDLIYRLQDVFWVAFAAVLAVTLGARLLRAWWDRRRGIVTLGYPGRRRVRIVVGATILEASRAAGIPHAAVCGGRGRCSTCRVRVGRGFDRLPPPDEAESRVLARIGAAPRVRLACQTRPTADLAVAPLLAPDADARALRGRPAYLQGEEREVAVLFADLRGFTALSEQRLPYDVVFLLNRYFAAMGGAVEQAGGRLDKFIGDGVMALFGVEQDAEAGCRSAVEAARLMAARLAELNEALAGDLDAPLRIGIGIHAGPVIVGQMGYGQSVSVTAIGDAVNTASRLEAMTKDFAAQLVVSEPVARRARRDLAGFPLHEIELRGKNERLGVRVVVDALDLSSVNNSRGDEDLAV